MSRSDRRRAENASVRTTPSCGYERDWPFRVGRDIKPVVQEMPCRERQFIQIGEVRSFRICDDLPILSERHPRDSIKVISPDDIPYRAYFIICIVPSLRNGMLDSLSIYPTAAAEQIVYSLGIPN